MARILLHDYSGHPFQVQLARALAGRGHRVHHVHFAQFQTPKGRLVRAADDPESFSVEGLKLDRPFRKHDLVRRRFQELAYGRLIAGLVREFRPDHVISSNTPIDSQWLFQRAAREVGAGFHFWVQDFWSIAIDKVLTRRFGPFAWPLAAHYRSRERRLLRASDSVVAITEDFLPILERWGVERTRCHVVRNWAPLDEIQPMARDTAWRREQGLESKRILLYAGTLGFKHDPGLLASLAQGLDGREDVVVVVISEGPGAEWLAGEATRRELRNLRLLPFQPYERLSEVLASADAVLAVIEAEASVYSVPSKVLSYLSAGRPILLSAPPENLAARTVIEAEAGFHLAGGRPDDLVEAARRLLDDPGLAERLSGNARRYAERTFDIERIADRFEAVLFGASQDAQPVAASPKV